MANFKQDIIRVVDKDEIIAVKIDKFQPWWKDTDNKYAPGNNCAGQIISYDLALALLDYEYDAGYGSQECHPILMWSKNYVYFIHEYDGSTSIDCIERNPEMLP